MDPARLRPEEADCDAVEIQGGYCLEGYDADALVLDYPVTDNYIQQLAEMWHSRYAFCNACFPTEYSHVVVVGVPHPRVFLDRSIPFLSITSAALAPLVAVGKEKEASVGVCIMAIDLEEDEEGEVCFRAVHLGSFPYTEFMEGEPCTDPELVEGIRECWTLVPSSLSEEEEEEARGKEEWISLGCIDLSSFVPGAPEKEKEEPETDKQRKEKQKLKRQWFDRQMLKRWLPDYRHIKEEDRPRTAFRAYNGGFVPVCTRLKEEAEQYAAALGLGCFAYDWYKKCKRYLICTWDAAYRIVTLRDTYTVPTADKSLLEYGQGRHLYEGMLPEFPQKLILDLEYYCKKNPDLDTDEMTQHALNYTSRFLQKMFDYTPAPEDWIMLDASSEKKASRHAILNMPERFFRNMHDATYFRDIMKAYMEAGIMMEDPTVTRLLVRADPKRDINGAVTGASSIADQVKLNGKWYTSFIDWKIVNHTFRLMRTYRATKWGEDDRPFVEAEMNKQKYDQDIDLFVNSLVSSVQPVDGEFEGWKVPQEEAHTTVRQVRALLVAQGVTTSALDPLVTDEMRGGKKRKHVSGSTPLENNKKWRRGNLRKHELESSNMKHQICVRAAEDAKPDLEPLIEETTCWRVWAVCDTSRPEEGSFANPRFFYIASRDSAYCPVRGNSHSSKGKMIIIINRKGQMSAKCLGGSCQGLWWKLDNQRLSQRVLDHLWPEGGGGGRYQEKARF